MNEPDEPRTWPEKLRAAAWWFDTFDLLAEHITIEEGTDTSLLSDLITGREIQDDLLALADKMDAYGKLLTNATPTDRWDEVVDFHNSLLEDSPNEWDEDESQNVIIKRWVDHLVNQVKQTGGCLLPWCHWDDGDDAGPCDHGYLANPQLPLILHPLPKEKDD